MKPSQPLQAGVLHPHAAVLANLRDFVYREHDIAIARILEAWKLPMQEKRDKGLAQRFRGLSHGSVPGTAWATLAGGESRFREGDRLRLHKGCPDGDMLAQDVVFELEEASRWLLRFRNPGDMPPEQDVRYFYAEQECTNLTPLYEQALDEIASSEAIAERILPLLSGAGEITFHEGDAAPAREAARAAGLNPRQADAVALALSAKQVACIQGPPGTGKTKVLALIAKLMVARGERVWMTSHTHTAINNALEKIAAGGVPTVKIGDLNQARGLTASVACVEQFSQWKERPLNSGYVVGATPFATCGRRLEMCEFHSILFDEASQVTVPLALMAMRRGTRFIFIGDQQQLPPVVASKSVLEGPPSIFARLTVENDRSVMLRQTYRMNRWLTEWPSRMFYDGELSAAGRNVARKMLMGPLAPSFAADVLQAEASAIFIPAGDAKARACSETDARLVASLCGAAREGGLALDQIGIVTPYRAQGRAIRKHLTRAFGWKAARAVIADTVERMQGQERELVILSLATGDLAYLAAVAEFFFQRERLNVSVTRAMTKLIIIGPVIAPEFSSYDEQLARNIALYRDLVQSCGHCAPSR